MRFLLVATAVLAVGCRQPAAPAEDIAAPVTEVNARSDDLVMTMAVTSLQIAVGESLAVSFVLRNTGETDRVLHSTVSSLFDFAVYASDGRTVMRKPFAAAAGRPSSAVRVLRGGEATAASIVWTPAAAGRYLLEGVAVWTAPSTALLTTPRLSIEVRPP